MSWQVPEALGAPVLTWELTRATRRSLLGWLRGGYCVWLVLQFAALASAFAAPYARVTRQVYDAMLSQRAAFLDDYLATVLQYQLVLIAAITPAVTAGSLGQEKERGTLFALFGTELTARQILLGKLLGRLSVIASVALVPVPALLFISGLTDRGAVPVLLALLQQATLAFAVGAACMLCAVWIRSAGDAVIASYGLLGLGYLFLRGLLASWPALHWLDPVASLEAILSADRAALRWAFLGALAPWACLGAACLLVGSVRLRKVCVEQRDRRPPRRLWAFRPPVGNDPIRWRECHVIGLAPLPILRVVPRWLALLAVFAFSAVMTGMAASSVATDLVPALYDLDLVRAYLHLRGQEQQVGDLIPRLGLLFIFLAEILVGVRCLTSVAEEKRRNTWDDLLLTARSFREITRGKMWGVLQATLPYVIAYAIPVFALASIGGEAVVIGAACWIVLPCAIVFVAALGGMDMLHVSPEMDETRIGGAFAFERRRRAERYAAAARR